MSAHQSVPLDVAAEIRELSFDGLGRKQIGHLTGINSSTVRNIISGTYKNYSEKLSVRESQGLINQCFRPLK